MPAETSIVLDTDEAQAPSPTVLEPNVVRSLSELRPVVSSAHVALEWLSIVAAAVLFERIGNIWFYPLLVAFIGARQHALLVLAHDAAHYRLFRNRALNDWLGEMLLAWPFVLLSMRAYRRNHFPHHRHLMTDRDPDWVRKQTPEWKFPQTRVQLTRMLLAYATGIGFLRFVLVATRLPKQPKGGITREEQIFARARVAYLVIAVAIVTALNGWRPVLLYWLVPYLTWMQLCFHIRSIAEHFAIHGRSGVFAQTRTVLATLFDRIFLVPKNVGYHLEHHLYPSVPFYRLPELHRILMSQPSYRDSAQVTHGYLRVLGECTASQARE